MSRAALSPLMAWHYTTADRLQGIQSTGLLLPATAGVPATERPVAWFSLHSRFEPTAAKGLIDATTGQRRTATLAEMLALCGGLVRLGMPARPPSFRHFSAATAAASSAAFFNSISCDSA